MSPIKWILSCTLLLSTTLSSANNVDSTQYQTDTIYRVSAISLSVPEPFRKGYFGVVGGGIFFQQRTRITKYFWDPDGNASFSIGLGNPEKHVGIETRVNIYGLANNKGAPNNFGEGTLDLHFSRLLSNDIWLGAGVFDLFGWDPEPPNKLTSFYFTAMKPFKLRNSGYFARSVYVTFGFGNGKFRQDKDYNILFENPWNYYGSVALQVLPEGNFIAEWNGFNAFSGISFLPTKKLPLQVLVGIDDIFHENKKLIVTATMSFYMARKSNQTKYSNYSLIPVTPPQTSRIL